MLDTMPNELEDRLKDIPPGLGEVAVIAMDLRRITAHVDNLLARYTRHRLRVLGLGENQESASTNSNEKEEIEILYQFIDGVVIVE